MKNPWRHLAAIGGGAAVTALLTVPFAENHNWFRGISDGAGRKEAGQKPEVTVKHMAGFIVAELNGEVPISVSYNEDRALNPVDCKLSISRLNRFRATIYYKVDDISLREDISNNTAPRVDVTVTGPLHSSSAKVQFSPDNPTQYDDDPMNLCGSDTVMKLLNYGDSVGGYASEAITECALNTIGKQKDGTPNLGAVVLSQALQEDIRLLYDDSFIVNVPINSFANQPRSETAANALKDHIASIQKGSDYKVSLGAIGGCNFTPQFIPVGASRP